MLRIDFNEEDFYFAMAKEQTDYYTRVPNPPALEGGFNSGVILMNNCTCKE